MCTTTRTRARRCHACPKPCAGGNIGKRKMLVMTHKLKVPSCKFKGKNLSSNFELATWNFQLSTYESSLLESYEHAEVRKRVGIPARALRRNGLGREVRGACGRALEAAHAGARA